MNRKPTMMKLWSGYSFFVSVAKFLLPLFALIALWELVIWPQLKSELEQTMTLGDNWLLEEIPETFSATNFLFLGTDNKDQPYVLQADFAEQSPKRESEIILTVPKADISLNDGTWIALRAKNGLYDQVQKLLNLYDSVEIFQNEGFTIETEDANFDLLGDTAYGQTAVIGYGPTGEIESEGFEIEQKGAIIRFTGTAKLTILPSSKE